MNINEYITGAQVRFEECSDCDDTAMNGIEVERTKIIPYSSMNINVAAGWHLKSIVSGTYDNTITTEITKTDSNQKDSYTEDSYSQAFTYGAEISASVSYGIASGSAKHTFNTSTTRSKKNSLRNIVSSSLTTKRTDSQKFSCPAGLPG